MRQIPLDLPARAAMGREDFLVAASNRLALESVEQWPDWPRGRLAVIGPKASGKTHLAHVWAALSDATILEARDLAGAAIPAAGAALVVENVDQLADLPASQRAACEEALFHIHNALAASGGSLLVTGSSAPVRWDIKLRDLVTRLGAFPLAELSAPDDALMAAVMVKLFADRQLQVSPDLIAYLVARIDRSLAAVEAIVAQLDSEGLARGRAITTRLAGELLRGGEHAQG